MEKLKNVEFELRTDFNITDSAIATFSDIGKTHDVIDDGTTGRDKTVVVMDSGIDGSHPVFSGTEISERVDVVGGGPGDEVGHGTAVAGTIAHYDPNVELISLRIFGDSGRTDGRTIYEAYQWLLDNADRIDVVNMSWGAQKKVQKIDDLHNELVEKGVHTVVAAGNSGGKGGSPATAEKAFSAGAIDTNGNLTRFSSYNPDYDNPDVCGVGKNNKVPRANGTDMGTVIDQYWVKASGTSFSSPVICAFYTRVLEEHPDASPRQMVKLFEDNSRDIADTPEDGAGIADYEDVTEDSPSDDVEEPVESSKASVWQFAQSDVIYLGADWLDTGNYEAVLREDTDDGIVVELVKK